MDGPLLIDARRASVECRACAIRSASLWRSTRHRCSASAGPRSRSSLRPRIAPQPRGTHTQLMPGEGASAYAHRLAGKMQRHAGRAALRRVMLGRGRGRSRSRSRSTGVNAQLRAPPQCEGGRAIKASESGSAQQRPGPEWDGLGAKGERGGMGAGGLLEGGRCGESAGPSRHAGSAKCRRADRERWQRAREALIRPLGAAAAARGGREILIVPGVRIRGLSDRISSDAAGTHLLSGARP